MITKDILRQAKTLISNPSNWIRYYGAKDEGGKVVPISDKTATCFCAVGAIARVCGKTEWEDVIIDLTDQKLFTYNNRTLWEINDVSSHETVMTMFDDLIERALG